MQDLIMIHKKYKTNFQRSYQKEKEKKFQTKTYM
jgi:hypothetical protein